MVQKIKAAVDARQDSGFVIKARTDAVAPLGIDEAVRRLNLYAEAGADCLFADALLTREDIAKVAKSVPKPLSVNMGLGIRSRPTTPLIAPKDLQAMGVAQVSYPRLFTAAALKGMQNALAVFKDELVGKNNVVDRPDLLASFGEINDLMGLPVLEELEKRFASK
jgi:2-methylisocitrate lyase-like PEP mutase family enzyme